MKWMFGQRVGPVGGLVEGAPGAARAARLGPWNADRDAMCCTSTKCVETPVERRAEAKGQRGGACERRRVAGRREPPSPPLPPCGPLLGRAPAGEPAPAEGRRALEPQPDAPLPSLVREVAVKILGLDIHALVGACGAPGAWIRGLAGDPESQFHGRGGWEARGVAAGREGRLAAGVLRLRRTVGDPEEGVRVIKHLD